MVSATANKSRTLAKSKKSQSNTFRCLNCDHPVTGNPKLFCSEACADEAKFVRYVRRCREDGRDQKADVKEAIRIRLAHILSGGYPEQERRISPETRAKVIARDKGRCQICGRSGNQIDHISGGSSSLNNLWLLCRDCHNLKTSANMVLVLPGSVEWKKLKPKRDSLMRRVDAVRAQRVCDDQKTWPSKWRDYMRERRFAIKERKRSSG